MALELKTKLHCDVVSFGKKQKPCSDLLDFLLLEIEEGRDTGNLRAQRLSNRKRTRI